MKKVDAPETVRRIGVISDTHGLMDPEALRLLRGVDRILHAGDVGAREVLGTLRRVAPVHAVRGNVDVSLRDLPPALLLTLSGVRILMVHDAGDPAAPHQEVADAIRDERPQVVISGHTHRPLIVERDGILFFNPGSAGPRRFRLPRALGFLHLEGGRARAELRGLTG